ncbi:MAG: HAMP domain-containing protein [Actinobacteria bacterium]|nr:HAMP domain-containing protein [Actinomycetota bacterium]
MNAEDINALKWKAYTLGVIIPVVTFHGLLTVVVLAIFRFDASMMLIYLYAALIATAVAVPPAVIAMVYRFRRIERVIAGAEGGEPGSGDANAEAHLKPVDGFPVFMAADASIAATIAVITEALFIYLIGNYNGLLTVIFILVGILGAIATGYMEFFVQYQFMEPARTVAYARYYRPGYEGGTSLRGRIVFLPILLSTVFLAVGWSVALNSYIFTTQDNLLERGPENVANIAARNETEEMGEDGRIDEDTAKEFALTENETLLLIDASGRVVDSMQSGSGFPAEEVEGLVEELQAQDKQSVMDERMNLVAARSKLQGSGYELVKIFPISPFLGYGVTMTLIFLVMTAIGGFAAFIFIKLTVDSITKPLKRLEEAADAVAEGDLTVSVEVSSSDELGQMSRSFISMVSSLHEISEQSMYAAVDTSEGASGVSATTEEAQASLDQLTSIIQQLAENASREAAMAEDVYALATEISEALESSSSQADSGVEVSQTSSTLAEEGRKDALVAVDRMEKVRDSITETAEIIKELGEQSEEIGIIVEVINNIADQTNLLALNAAIEAARAQEQGRGFSVVAEEVRKLAEESTQSTNRISNLVKGIQKNTATAVETAKKGTEEVFAGMEAVQVAGNSLERIYDYVKRAEELSSTIAGTTRKQLDLGNKILEAMGEIRNIAEQNASSTEEIAAASEEQSAAMQELSSTSVQLSELAEKMRGTVDKYRL